MVDSSGPGDRSGLGRWDRIGRKFLGPRHRHCVGPVRLTGFRAGEFRPSPRPQACGARQVIEAAPERELRRRMEASLRSSGAARRAHPLVVPRLRDVPVLELDPAPMRFVRSMISGWWFTPKIRHPSRPIAGDLHHHRVAGPSTRGLIPNRHQPTGVGSRDQVVDPAVEHAQPAAVPGRPRTRQRGASAPSVRRCPARPRSFAFSGPRATGSDAEPPAHQPECMADREQRRLLPPGDRVDSRNNRASGRILGDALCEGSLPSLSRGQGRVRLCRRRSRTGRPRGEEVERAADIGPSPRNSGGSEWERTAGRQQRATTPSWRR
jgi:hypothetical protein